MGITDKVFGALTSMIKLEAVRQVRSGQFSDNEGVQNFV